MFLFLLTIAAPPIQANQPNVNELRSTYDEISRIYDEAIRTYKEITSGMTDKERRKRLDKEVLPSLERLRQGVELSRERYERAVIQLQIYLTSDHLPSLSRANCLCAFNSVSTARRNDLRFIIVS